MQELVRLARQQSEGLVFALPRFLCERVSYDCKWGAVFRRLGYFFFQDSQLLVSEQSKTCILRTRSCVEDH